MASDELTTGIDAIARDVLDRYEVPLAKVGLRAEYKGIAERDEVDGMRDSVAAVWFYREGELVDVIELPVEVPGLAPTTPEHAREMLTDGVSETLLRCTWMRLARSRSSPCAAADTSIGYSCSSARHAADCRRDRGRLSDRSPAQR